jgi:hypothetical protein
MIILVILFLQGDLYSEPTKKNNSNKENIITQIKKINKKVKKAEMATKEMLSVLKKLIEQKKLSKKDDKDFLNREIK